MHGSSGFRAARIGSVVAALALGAAGGFAASRLGLPLAWMIGSLAVCAAVAIAGWPLAPLPGGRECGQMILGTTIGLRFTPAILHETIDLLPAMAASTAVVIVATMAAALILRPLGQVDAKTAFFATAAAGMADMAVVAHQKDADVEVVLIVHAVRVTAIVMTVPLLVSLFHDGAAGASPAVQAARPVELALLVGLAAAGAFAMRRLRLPNPWLLGPVLIVGALAALGATSTSVPPALLVGAQVLMGVWLGLRFRRDTLTRLPRVTLAALVIAAGFIAAAAGGAALLSRATGLPFATGFLALAPASISEMALTATIMHLDASIVTAFHVMRIAVIVTTILLAYRLFDRLSRRLDRLGGRSRS